MRGNGCERAREQGSGRFDRAIEVRPELRRFSESPDSVGAERTRVDCQVESQAEKLDAVCKPRAGVLSIQIRSRRLFDLRGACLRQSDPLGTLRKLTLS